MPVLGITCHCASVSFAITGPLKVWLGVLNLHLPLFNDSIQSVCIPLFDQRGFPLTDYSVCRRRPLTSGEQPRLYGTLGVPPNAPPPPYSPIPPSGIYVPPSEPPRSYQKQVPVSKAITFWLVACIAFILFQDFLMIAHIDVLEPLIDIQPAKRHALRENSTLIKEKGKMEDEKEAMELEKELWKKAEKNRVPHGAFWEDVLPARDCRAYGKREYWGVLRNIPQGWSAIDACMNMPVEVKGVTIRRPYRCEYTRGSVHGYWMVDWDQPDCKPWFRDFQDTVGQNWSLFLPTRSSQSLSYYRDARATGLANVKSRLRWRASTKDKEIGSYCVTAHR